MHFFPLQTVIYKQCTRKCKRRSFYDCDLLRLRFYAVISSVYFDQTNAVEERTEETNSYTCLLAKLRFSDTT